MSEFERSELQNEIVRELVESKAINIEAINAVFSKFGEQAAIEGIPLGQRVDKFFHWICIPPYMKIRPDINVDFNQHLK